VSRSLSQARLKELLSYDPETGLFKRRESRGGQNEGDVAGAVHDDRYVIVGVDGQRYLAHRLAFLYVKGYMPPYVDHEDGDGFNNKWCNLREATYSQNGANAKLNKNNTSGHRGVKWEPSRNRWRARIKHQNKLIELGRFKDLESAVTARLEAENRLFGEFARKT
jgi:hypothetical protein